MMRPLAELLQQADDATLALFQRDAAVLDRCDWMKGDEKVEMLQKILRYLLSKQITTKAS